MRWIDVQQRAHLFYNVFFETTREGTNHAFVDTIPGAYAKKSTFVDEKNQTNICVDQLARICRNKVKNLIEVERCCYRPIDLREAPVGFFLNGSGVCFENYCAFVTTAPRPLISSVCSRSSCELPRVFKIRTLRRSSSCSALKPRTTRLSHMFETCSWVTFVPLVANRWDSSTVCMQVTFSTANHCMSAEIKSAKRC